jgi:hypothetical protein
MPYVIVWVGAPAFSGVLIYRDRVHSLVRTSTCMMRCASAAASVVSRSMRAFYSEGLARGAPRAWPARTARARGLVGGVTHASSLGALGAAVQLDHALRARPVRARTLFARTPVVSRSIVCAAPRARSSLSPPPSLHVSKQSRCEDVVVARLRQTRAAHAPLGSLRVYIYTYMSVAQFARYGGGVCVCRCVCVFTSRQ